MREPARITSIKLAVVGAKGCGKSALTVRFLTRRFIGEYDSQADVCVERRLQVADRVVDIHLKDTAGCDWLKGPSALIGWSTALVLVYSINDARSFELTKFMLQKLNINKRLDPGCILLLGNKNDLEHLREVSVDNGKKLAQSYGISFKETSAAIDYDGVDSAFRRLLFDTLSTQISKTNIFQTSCESLDNITRKNSSVVRDNPTRRSVRRVSSRQSSGSVDSMRDSVSSYSDEEHSMPSLIITTHEEPSDDSHTATNKRRKISIPSIFEKFKQSSVKKIYQ